jgi:hypothetical protein
MAPLILSRIDELKERARQMALANKEFQLRKQATMQGLGLEQQRFGLERRSAAALGEFTEAELRDALNRRGGGGVAGGGGGGAGGTSGRIGGRRT